MNLVGRLATAGTAVAGVIAGALYMSTPAQSAPQVPAGTTASPTGTPTPTPTTPTPTPSPKPTDHRLLPDLIAVPATQFSVRTTSAGRRLRFTSSLGNIGNGPIEVRPNQNHPCPAGQHNSTQIIYRDANKNGRYNPTKDTKITRHRAGCMIFHPQHNHWHFKASARYALLDPSKEGRVVVSARRKVSFCLRDSARLPARYGTWTYKERYGHCTRTSPQGISIGWMDVYQSFLAGQSLKLPKNLKNGLYCMETTVDPIDQLVESNNDNNRSVRAIAIKGKRVGTRPAKLCR
jgi:hypothetical protein